MSLSGSMTRQVCPIRLAQTEFGLELTFACVQTETDQPVHDANSHVVNMGRLIEDMEIKMRNLLQEVYFGKTRDVVFDLRSLENLEKARRQRELQKELVGFIKR